MIYNSICEILKSERVNGFKLHLCSNDKKVVTLINSFKEKKVLTLSNDIKILDSTIIYPYQIN